MAIQTGPLSKPLKHPDQTERRRCENVTTFPVSREHLRLWGIFNKHHIPVHFKPTNTLRQKCVHPKDKTFRNKESNVVYDVQCSKDCTDLYIGKKKKPLQKLMAKHRKANPSGQDCCPLTAEVEKSLFCGQQGEHLGWKRQMV